MSAGRYQRILIALDASDDDDEVIEGGIEIDPKAVDHFHVVTVIAPMLDGMSPMSGASFATSWPLHDMEAALTKEVTDTVCERVARVGVPPERVAVRHGRPAAEILAEAERLDADLLIVGSHGRGAVSRVMLGSTANSVLHGAKCDVLTVRITD